MTHVMRARDIIGLPVVTINGGEDVAEVRDVVFDGDHHHIMGFTLNKRGFFSGRMKSVLPSGSVVAIGANAVMVQDPTAVSDEGALEQLGDVGSTKSIIGNTVLSADGHDLGEVVAVIVATGGTPRAVGYEIDPGSKKETVFVPISAQRGLSGTNLVLPAEATEFIRNDLAGFGESIESYRVAEIDQMDGRPS